MKAFVKLGLGILGIILFIWGLVPLCLRGAQAKQVKTFIEERDLDAGALFYTDSPEAGSSIYFIQKNEIATYGSE
ncbi:MAG: hypothetical protein HRU41_23675 [Saprospiraceae bacterium]|nr:hypothetical protein [Saprospiraceae bacterium]